MAKPVALMGTFDVDLTIVSRSVTFEELLLQHSTHKRYNAFVSLRHSGTRTL